MVYYLTLGMSNLLSRIHTRVGDLWWYSAMIFIACRSGDVIQAFIGLWLVPKYVGPQELGAVLPLQQLSGLFAVPLAVIAIVFAKYVNVYATRGDRGKVKSFIHDVLLASALVFLVCAAGAFLVAPFFYERLRVSAGLLTVLILAAGFASNVATLFTSALQGLKKFRTLTVINIVGAPIRLVTLLIGMPVRPLSGYILGQAAPPAACSLLAAFSLRKDLKAVPVDKTWRRDLGKIFFYAWPLAIYTVAMTICCAISTTIYRQRLPEIESGANYILSRFSEMAMYVGASLSVVLFPLAAEAHERGQEMKSLLWKSIVASLLTSLLFAAVFFFCADKILSLTSAWSEYAQFSNLLPQMACIAGSSSIIGAIVTYDIACRRFASAQIAVVFNVLWVASLAALTGADFFRGLLPDRLIEWTNSLHVANIYTLTWISAGVNALQIFALSLRLWLQRLK
jgi:O-antigen/teichoic acid export membrane protein